MVEIKPDEISAILRQQLSNFNASADLEEVGTVRFRRSRNRIASG